MPADPLQQVVDSLGVPVEVLVVLGIAVLAGIVLFVITWRVLRARRAPAPEPVAELSIDLDSLGTAGPPTGPPILEHYNVPVRLAAIVLAPTGRAGQLPTSQQLAELADHIVPGLAQVVVKHGPLVRVWPAQLSAEGFAHMFFAHVRLPGDGGKGTPWCSVAGRFKVQRHWLMAGLLLRAEKPNNFSQSIVRQEHEWLGILRVKSTS